MLAVYEPKGAALEYAPLACNVYSGCTNGCRYCYVPACLRSTVEDFHREVRIRPGIITQAAKDLRKLRAAGIRDRVHLCFTCDPYPEIEESAGQTRSVLEVLKVEDFPCSVLTKAGGSDPGRDFPLLAKMDATFGVTLCWLDDHKRAEWEPKAGSVEHRLDLLARAKSLGIPTWASLEPVVDPDEGMSVLERLLPVADTIKVGRWNHDARANGIDWGSFARAVKKRLVEAGKPHLLKHGLAELV